MVRKTDYINGTIGENYFLVDKEYWLMEDDGESKFQLYLTKIKDDQINFFFVNGNNYVIAEELPLSKRKDYLEI